MPARDPSQTGPCASCIYSLDDTIVAIASPPAAPPAASCASAARACGVSAGCFHPRRRKWHARRRGDPPDHALEGVPPVPARAVADGGLGGHWRLPAPRPLAVRRLLLARAGGATPAEPWPRSIRWARPPLLETVVRSVCRRGARLAEPGEFTLRAFLSGRIDLTAGRGRAGRDRRRRRGPSWMRPWSSWPAGCRGRCGRLRERSAGPAGRTWRPGSISPTRTCRSSPPRADSQTRLADSRAAGGRALPADRRPAGESAGRPRGGADRACPTSGKSSLFNALAAGSGAGFRAARHDPRLSRGRDRPGRRRSAS